MQRLERGWSFQEKRGIALRKLRRRIRGSINFATSNRTVRAAGMVRTAVYLIEKSMLHGNREAYAYTIGGRVEAMRSSLLRHSTLISLTDIDKAGACVR